MEPMRKYRLFFVACALAALLAGALGQIGATPARAATLLTKLSPAGGWQTPNYANHYALAQTGEQFSSAAVGDINGDGVPDVVAGFPDGMVYGWRTDTGARWFQANSGPGAVQGSIVLVDLTGDGIPEVLVSNTNGDVTGFNSAGGWVFHVRAGNPQHPLPGVFSTPAVADIDRDGQLDVVATSWDHYLHAWHLNGQELAGFPVFLKDTSWSSPAVADIDGDGWPEIVFGFDCDGVQGQDCAPQRGGYVGVVRHDGSWQPGWPRFYNGQVIWSSPAVVDLNGDGRLDIVVGTGNMPMTGGFQVLAFNADGSYLPGWPVNVGGKTTSSPAVGDIDGDGRPDVAIVAEDGKLYAFRGNGSLIFSRCIANDQVNGCPLPLHASPSIADIDNNGRNEVLVGGEQWVSALDGAGNTVYRGETISGTNPVVAAPTVASVGGKTWIVAVSGINSSGERGQMFAWTTNTALGSAPWPTFRQNFRRTGADLDTTPPTVTLGALVGTNSTTKTVVSWSGTDGGSGVAAFDVDISDNGGPFVRWLTRQSPSSRSGTTASGSAPLYGFAGHTYGVRVRAADRAGNTSGFTPTGITAFSANATNAQPFREAYAVSAFGPVSALDSPPVGGPSWGYPIARGIAARPAGGGWVLDGWGGLQPFGGAPPLSVTGYWPGRDVARGVALGGDGSWGYVVDLFGGLHELGGAPHITNGPYWPGQDPVRGIALSPGTTKANPGGYVLDDWGGLHPFGSARPISVSGYWPGQDVTRGVAFNADGTGYVIDDWAGIHSVNGAAPVSNGPWWPGQDVARGIAVVGSGGAPRGWILDSWGGVHPFGSAPALDGTLWGPSVAARGISLVP
ncbi:MAG: repeat-containing protein [Acidimicrobiales bacterium]|nr:repeat-containing protein [Acidimicrobiales bacterium]